MFVGNIYKTKLTNARCWPILLYRFKFILLLLLPHTLYMSCIKSLWITLRLCIKPLCWPTLTSLSDFVPGPASRALHWLDGYDINFFCFTETEPARQGQFNPPFDLTATPQPDLVITQTSPTKNRWVFYHSKCLPWSSVREDIKFSRVIWPA